TAVRLEPMGRSGGSRATPAALHRRYAAWLGGVRLHALGPRPLRLRTRRRQRARASRGPANAVAGRRGGHGREPAHAVWAIELLIAQPGAPPHAQGRGRSAAAARWHRVCLAWSTAGWPHAPERQASALARRRAAYTPAPR